MPCHWKQQNIVILNEVRLVIVLLLLVLFSYVQHLT